jgi:hypothetical protein
MSSMCHVCLARHPGWVSTAIVMIIAITFYAGLFRALGGFSDAAAALRRWGERSWTIPNHNIAP